MRDRLARAAVGVASRLEPALARGLGAVRSGLEAAEHAAARSIVDLLGPDFEQRLERVRAQVGPTGVDPFGLDPDWAKHAVALAAFFHRFWFRTIVHDVDRVPHGRVILVANHSGQVPFDGLVIGATMFLDAEPPRVTRSMVEKWTQTLPFVSTFFQRVGQVVGAPENARTLLERGECVLVFPEGVRGISKPFRERYRLAEFGAGFARLALETRTPVVPVGVVGAEEQYISLGNLERLAKLVGAPSLPLVPQVLLPGGQLPLPVRYRVYFGDPVRLTGDADDEAAVDAAVLEVRSAIEALLRRGLSERTSLFA